MRRLTATILAITALAFIAIGPAPRYLEELRIGGGFGEPHDGGADLARDGALDTDGPIQSRADLTAGAFDDAADHRLTLRVPDAKTATLQLFETDDTHGGALWFDGALDTLRLGTHNGASPIPALDIARGSADITLQGKLTTPERITANGLNLGASALGTGGALGIKAPLYTGPNSGLKILHNAAGSSDFGILFQSNGTDIFKVSTGGAATITGSVSVSGGTANFGVDGATRGVITAWDGAGGNTPGALKLHSPNGTPWYVFVEDDGTLKIANALPSSNADGDVVGLQF